MFGIGKSREEKRVAEVAAGIVEIIDFNAAELGFRAIKGLPRELAQRETLLAAILGLVFATCEMVGTDNRKTLYVVLQTLFPQDMSVAMDTIDKAVKLENAESIFDSVRTYLSSLADTPKSSGNRDMLFMVEYMKPEEAGLGRSEPSGMTAHETEIELDDELVSEPDLSDWEEYSSVNQGPAVDPVIDRSRGSSFRTAIKVASHSEEYAWMERLYPGMQMETQSLYENEGKAYDVLEGRDKNGNFHKIYFDISAFF